MAKDTISEKKGLLTSKGENRIGTFDEGYGGGTPIEAGKKAPSDDWKEAHRVKQPRDAEGKFTYNSANAKELKYGPSRGITTPPFLLGLKMPNVIKKGTATVIDGKTYVIQSDMTLDEFIDKCKDKLEMDKFAKEIIGRKKGRKSEAEKEQMEKGEEGLVKKKGEEDFVVLTRYTTPKQITAMVNKKIAMAAKKQRFAAKLQSLQATVGKKNTSNAAKVQRSLIPPANQTYIVNLAAENSEKEITSGSIRRFNPKNLGKKDDLGTKLNIAGSNIFDNLFGE